MMDILETLVFVGSLVIVIHLFIFSPNQVKGASMEHTFHNGEYILTSKIAYKLGSPKKGDVIVFKSPRNPDIDYIKRIIGVPGDMIVIRGTQVFVNDVLLNEPYIADKTTIIGGFMQEAVPEKVPPDHLFVMGDNRPNSSDSRDFGFIPMTDIIGKVFYRYLPIPRAGFIKNPD